MSQLLDLVTRMHGTKVWRLLTTERAGDGTLDCGRRSAKYFGVADLQWIFVLGSYFYLSYFTYDSARGITWMIQKRLDE